MRKLVRFLKAALLFPLLVNMLGIVLYMVVEIGGMILVGPSQVLAQLSHTLFHTEAIRFVALAEFVVLFVGLISADGWLEFIPEHEAPSSAS